MDRHTEATKIQGQAGGNAVRDGGRVSKASAGGELEEDAEAKSSVELKILRGVGLKGDSMFDKLDSFVIVKPGTGTDISRDDASGRGDGVGFRTPTQYDKGPNPEINASGKLGYSDEEGLEFYVYSEDKRSNELIGVAFLPKAEFLTESFSGKLALAGAFSGKGASKKAGHLVVDVSYVRWLFRALVSHGTRRRSAQRFRAPDLGWQSTVPAIRSYL